MEALREFNGFVIHDVAILGFDARNGAAIQPQPFSGQSARKIVLAQGRV